MPEWGVADFGIWIMITALLLITRELTAKSCSALFFVFEDVVMRDNQPKMELSGTLIPPWEMENCSKGHIPVSLNGNEVFEFLHGNTARNKIADHSLPSTKRFFRSKRRGPAVLAFVNTM